MPASRALLNGWPLVAGQSSAAGVVVPPAPSPTLQALLLSTTAWTVGQAFSATISGRTAGSTLTLSGAGAAGLSISGTTVSGTPTTAGSVNLVETLAGATNSPRTTSGAATVSAAAAPTGLAMSQLPAGRVYQRSTTTGGDAGKGSGSITVPITLTATASSIEYRLRDADATSTTVKDWTSAGSNVAASATSVVCAGVPANAKRYLLDLRANGDASQVILGTAPVMMGRIIAASGQSQMVRQFAKASGYAGTLSSLGVAVTPYCGVYATYADGSVPGGGTAAWGAPSDAGPYTSTFAAEFLRRQVDASGVACGFVGHSVGSTAVASWAPGAANNVALRAILDAVGGFEAFYWHQGGDDAGAGTAKATYKSALDAMFADITARNAIRGAGYTKLLTAMATRTSGGAGTTATVTAIRQAHKEWAATNGGVYLEPHDIVLEDSVHQGQPGNIVLAQHAHRALATSDAGATFGTPSFSADNTSLYIPVTLPSGATSIVLTGSAATRLSIFPTGTTTGALTVSSLTWDASGTRLVAVLSAAATTAVDVYAFRHPDPSGTAAFSDMIRDNRTDGDGIAVGRSVEPSTSGPVTSAAPNVVAPPVGAGGPAVGEVFLINTYFLNGGGSQPTPAAGWNNLDLSVNKSSAPLALKNSAGGTSPLTAYLTNGTNSGNTQSVAEGVTPFPASVASTFLFADKANSLGSGASSLIKTTIAGFAAGTTWRVEMFAYRNNVATRLQDFVLNGQTITTNIGTAGTPANISATFNDVSPSGGLIEPSVTQNGSENLAYLTAIRLTRSA